MRLLIAFIKEHRTIYVDDSFLLTPIGVLTWSMAGRLLQKNKLKLL